MRRGWHSRPRNYALLLQGNGHDIIGREELELLMTRSKSRRVDEDRHPPSRADRAVIPLDAKISYHIQQAAVGVRAANTSGVGALWCSPWTPP
jgi:hypothetical protein